MDNILAIFGKWPCEASRRRRSNLAASTLITTTLNFSESLCIVEAEDPPPETANPGSTSNATIRATTALYGNPPRLGELRALTRQHRVRLGSLPEFKR